ncbi:MAG: hypothetical protein ACE5KO_05045 [Candidatus Bathyarchaeia archaeon]
MSDLPSIIAAEAILKLNRPTRPKHIEKFFTELAISLFKISSVRGRLLGHVKIFANGVKGGTARANITGTIKSQSVDVNAKNGESEFKVWINVITYKVEERELRRRFALAMASKTEFIDLRLVNHQH